MSDRYFQHTFQNGLTLVGEKMPGMKSVAMTLLVPAGVSSDPDGRVGVSVVLSDLVLRGAGQRDSRALTDHLDSLGLQRSSTVGVYHTRFGAAGVGDKLLEGLPAYADILIRPQMPDDGFDSAKDLCLQAIAGIDDDPRQKLMIKLREQHFPMPLGRNSMGAKADVEALTVEEARKEQSRRYVGRGAILSVAGDVDFDRYRQAVAKQFGDLRGSAVPETAPKPAPGGYRFEEQKSEQTHIGIAYPSIPETHSEYFTVRLAIDVLSGGMSGRLFTEVREKRGLCYSVWAGHSSVKGMGHITGYAGTSNDRAQATLDCFLTEVRRMQDGITEAELARAKTGLKSSLIMGGESTSGRAGALAYDWFMHGRLRTLDEIKAAIEEVTLDRVNAYLKANPAGPFTVVIVGPKALKVDGK